MATKVNNQSIHGRNADAILDDGATGLQYFIQLLPRYVKAFGSCSESEESICAKYDEQRGMNLDKLANTAEALDNALKVGNAELAVQQGLSQKMATVWSSGQAAEAASTMLGQQLTAAAEDCVKLDTAVSAFAFTTVKLRNAVSQKADHVKALVSGHQVQVGGKSPADIDELIDNTDTGGFGNAFMTTATLGAYGNYLQFSKWQADNWLKETFKPDFDGKLANFVSMCSTTDTTVRQAYTTLKAATDALDSDPYPRPAGVVTTDNKGNGDSEGNGNGPGGTPATTTPAATTPAATTPAATTPVTTTPATNPDDTLSEAISAATTAATSLLTTAASVLGENMDTIASAVNDGIENAVEGVQSLLDADGDGQLDALQAVQNASAEFDLAGNNVKFEMGEDGTLEMVVTGVDGQSQEYRVTIGPDGTPVIQTDGADKPEDAEESGKPEDSGKPEEPAKAEEPPAPTGDGAPTGGTGGEAPGTGGEPPQGTGGTGVPSVPGGRKRAEDGEHTPQSLPTGGAEEPVDTGAELAEAGPL
ncbi:hypothetical protein [Nocardia mangyaensis]|uniref:hypothetical protein n=1 Tax=Nocardia mangyaensis TaxID=2213200 RepID=UPI0026760D7D|nr:hypothetical protein [Nocardia mangyaensis]MDO3647229.1 hypothetical protein [Nocardia mangyaensis]